MYSAQEENGKKKRHGEIKNTLTHLHETDPFRFLCLFRRGACKWDNIPTEFIQNMYCPKLLPFWNPINIAGLKVDVMGLKTMEHSGCHISTNTCYFIISSSLPYVLLSNIFKNNLNSTYATQACTQVCRGHCENRTSETRLTSLSQHRHTKTDKEIKALKTIKSLQGN